jgi:predicted metal-dependent hydrolase
MDFEYTLIRSPRRKTVGIMVNPDGMVTVRAPERLSDIAIRQLVERKSGWIREKISENLRNHSQRTPKIFENGEEVLYLGKTYRLETVPGGKSVTLLDDRLRIGIPKGFDGREHSRVKALLSDWYRDQAVRFFAERILFWRERVNAYPKTMRVKQLKSRWGSCSSRGNLNFNWLLILAPPSIVDYVVVHELCHFHHPNHSRAFWDTVGSVLPDYKERRNWLRANTELLTLQ